MAISSKAGASILQGPHHSAQKSTRTGTGDLSTSVSKLPSPTSIVAFIIPLRVWLNSVTAFSLWSIGHASHQLALMPAAAKRLDELHCRHLPQAEKSGGVKFRRQQRALRLDHFEVADNATFI